MPDGIINLDKPAGLHSANAVRHLKRLLPPGAKVGHAGALDPFATGVLLLLVGKAAKCCEMLMDQPKTYDATIKLGATTETDDRDSPENAVPGAMPPSGEEIERAAAELTGVVSQRPPRFSAIKIAGRRAYDLARSGKGVDPPPRNVRIYAIDILSFDWPILKLRIDSGRGTYIRSIARDLGEKLKTGGYLTELRRTRIGRFTIEQSVSMDLLRQGGVESHLQPA
jgi:tRNA pseudouridine55 synthase